MATVDAARNGRQFSDAELDEPGVESPPRPTVGHAEKFNADQFGSIVALHEKDLGYDAEADAQGWMNDLASKRHPHYIGGDETSPSVHEWLSGTNRDETNGSAQ